MREKKYINIYDYTMTGTRRESTLIYSADNVSVSRNVLVGYNGNDNYTHLECDILYVVLEGEAAISIKGDRQYILVKGDILPVPQHCRHRIDSASSYPHCIMLELQHKN